MVFDATQLVVMEYQKVKAHRQASLWRFCKDVPRQNKFVEPEVVAQMSRTSPPRSEKVEGKLYSSTIMLEHGAAAVSAIPIEWFDRSELDNMIHAEKQK